MDPSLGVKAYFELFSDGHDGDGHEYSIGGVDEVGGGAKSEFCCCQVESTSTHKLAIILEPKK